MLGSSVDRPSLNCVYYCQKLSLEWDDPANIFKLILCRKNIFLGFP